MGFYEGVKRCTALINIPNTMALSFLALSFLLSNFHIKKATKGEGGICQCVYHFLFILKIISLSLKITTLAFIIYGCNGNLRDFLLTLTIIIIMLATMIGISFTFGDGSILCSPMDNHLYHGYRLPSWEPASFCFYDIKRYS